MGSRIVGFPSLATALYSLARAEAEEENDVEGVLFIDAEVIIFGHNVTVNKRNTEPDYI